MTKEDRENLIIVGCVMAFQLIWLFIEPIIMAAAEGKWG